MLRKKGLFYSFLIGGAIGSVIALLFAPKQGKHLRNELSTKANELFKEGKNQTIDTWNETKEKARSTLGKVNDYLNSGMEKVERKLEK